MTEPVGRGHAAILDPTRAQEQITVGRRAAGEALGGALAAYVDYFWWVRWQTDPRYTPRVLPAPVVHLSAERHDGEPRLLVTGVQRRTFERVLEGTGHVAAAAFRPGCFRPLLRDRVSDLTGRTVPAADVLGRDDREVASLLLQPGIGDDEIIEVLGGWIAATGPEPDPLADELAALVTAAEEDRALTRADQLAGIAGVSLRTLQRQFGAYVGIGPKWVVQRFRLLDAAAEAHAGARSGVAVDWADLAARLGFADQSHLTRAFTAVVGRSPAAYARDVAEAPRSPIST